MRRLVQGIVAAAALLVALPANAAIWYATFWGDTIATFAFNDESDPLDPQPSYYSEHSLWAKFPGVYVDGSDLGDVWINANPGTNYFAVRVDDNNYGGQAFASIKTVSDIFAAGLPFGQTIDYLLQAGDEVSAVHYPDGIGNPGNAVTGISRFTFSTIAPAVPEPATWAMMIVGFGAIGVWLRRRRLPVSNASVALYA